MLDLENLPDKAPTPAGVAKGNIGVSLDTLPDSNASTLGGLYRQNSMSADEYAKARSLSRTTGLPMPTVQNQPAEATKLAAEPDWANLETLAPKTAAALVKSTDLFNLSKDDTEGLSWWERGLRMGKRAADYIVSSPDAKGGLIGDVGAGVLRANTGVANVFRAAAELPAPLIDPLVGRILPENPLRRVAEGFREMGANTEATAKRLSPNDPTIIGGGVSSGVQSLTQNLLMLPMALLPGGQAAALSGMVGITGGEAYGKAREEGLNAYNAAIYGASQGVIEYATERGPLGALVKDIKAGSGLFKTLINNVAREVPGEQVATVLQDLNEWAALNPEKTFGDYLADRPAAAAQTLIATVIGVGGNVAVMRGLQSVVDNVSGATREGARVQDAMVDFAKLTEMFERAAQSKTRERAPDSFAQFVQELADSDEGAISEVFIDPQTLVEVLNQAGVEQGAFLAQMPSVVEQLSEASVASAPIALPIGELMAYVPGTGLEAALLPHLRTAPDALSQIEAQQVMGESQAFMQSAAKQAMEQADDVAALEASAEAVRGKILEQLGQTKRFTADVNEAYANLVRDFYTATSSRLRTADGKTVTPEQMWNGGWTNAAGVVQPARQLRIRAEGMPDTPVLEKNNGLRSIVSDATATEVEGALGSYKKGGTTDPLSPEQRSQAEALLTPLAERANAAKPAFDALVSKIGESFGMKPKLAPVKGLKRAAEKLVVDGGGDINTIRDMLRATVVVPRVEDVQAAIEQVRENFEIVRVKDRFATPTESGYRDVLINVRMPDGTVAEIQINVPAMLAAKEDGHKLYEMARVLPEGDARRVQLEELQTRLYAEAFDSAMSASNSAAATGTPYENTLAESGNGLAPAAPNATQLPSGNLATGMPSTSNNSAPSGISNISGTSNDASIADAETANQQVLQEGIDTALAERPAPAQASLNDFTKLGLTQLMNKQGWAVLTAEDPGAAKATPEQNAVAMANLEADLREMGVDYLPVIGKYGDVQNGFIVVGLAEEEALALGRKYGQESVLTRSGLIYGSGAIDPATGVLEVYDTPPGDFYTEIPGTGAYFSVEIDFEARRAGVFEQSMSTRQPWGKPKKNGPPIEDAMAQQLTVGMEAVRRNPTLLEKFAAKIGNIISLRTSTAETAEQRLEDYIQQLTDNLLWLHDTTPAEIRQRAKLWYDGARAITERFVRRYGNRYSDMQVAGVLAVMSPQMDWFQNVTLGERILDIYDGQQDFRWTDEMTAAINQTAATDYPDDLAAIAGKTLGEIDNTFQQALWVVAYDRAYNPTDFRVVTPEGDFTDFVKTGKGENMKGSWANGFGPVEKSIAILRDGSAANVSAQLGEKHKVRNFYNNIFAPTAPDGSVTIDTHAVAAATLLPLAGSSPIVADNFGAAGSDAATGVQGSYPVYAEAYRRAAAQRGVLAREMQSITWEAVRGLFTPAFKARYKRNPAEFDNIWNEYHAGNLSLDAARQRLFDFAGGITAPDWAGRDSQGADQRWSSSYAGDVLAQGGLDGAAGPRAGGDLAAAAAALGRVELTGVHFSKAARTRLDGLYYGSGLKGLEADRLSESTDSRLKQRVYFYVDEGKGVRPEAGVGGIAHSAQLTNLYDAKADPLRLWRGDINDIETRILDAGFSGYYIRDAFNQQGAAVVLGPASRSIPAQQIANPTTAAPARAAAPQQYKRGLLSREINAIDLPAVQAVAPSANIRAGNFVVDAAELEAARQVLSSQGVELPAGAFNQTLAEDMEGQGAFLEAKAREAGYPSVDEWVANDIVGFMQAAEQWREMNPAEVLNQEAEWPRMETRGDNAYEAAPGEYITVLRLADRPGLDNVNAASAEGLASFLAMVDDFESAAGSEARGSDTIYAYRVRVPEGGFGPYSLLRGGRPAGGDVTGPGRQPAKYGGFWYSFPAGTEAELLGTLPLAQARRVAEQISGEKFKADYEKEKAEYEAGTRQFAPFPLSEGSGNFDMIGTNLGSRALRAAFTAAGMPLRQPARGTFSPSQLRIDLLKDADLSTFLHETGHFFLEMLADIATQPGAPQDVVDDMGAIMKWFGVADAKTWMGMTLDQKRPYHEKFAESFEQYLFEGKAPSAELRPMFRRFRDFLTSVYKSLQDFMKRYDTQLTDEVRGVFDRLIATQEQIAQAEREAGMLPDFDATNEAIEKLGARSLRDLKWVVNARSKLLKQLQADVEEKRKAMREEVTAEVRAMREYAVQRFLKFGELRNEETGATEKVEGGKLSMPILKEMYGEGPAAQWRYLATNMVTADEASGLHPNMVAELFGFRNGDEMVRAIIAAMPEQSAIDGLTDQRLLERYGDLVTDKGIERAANEAIHNEARARFVATELKAMREAMNVRERTPAGGSVNVILRAAKDFAQNLVSRRKVRDLKPGVHTAAESRAARRAEQAQAAGDTQGAIIAKRDQLLNHYAAKYTSEAQAEIDKKLDYLRKFDKDSVRAKLPAEYLAQIDALLDRFDLRRGVSLKAIDKRATLVAWVQSQQELGLDPAIPEELLDEALRKSYKEMTVEEFRGLVDTVRNIEHLGRLKDKLLTLKERREFAAVVAELEASIRDNATKEREPRIDAPSKLDEAKDAVRAFFSMHRKVSSLIRQMDGLKDGGPFWRVLVQSMNAAGDREAVGRNKATIALSKIFEPLLKSSKMRQMVNIPAIGRSLSLEARLAVALNWGNDANRQRVMDGDNWSAAQVEAILATLTPEQLKFVQKVWDYVDSFWPEIRAKEERVSGVAPEKVQASPFIVTLADGTQVEMAGGYYPIKYDPDRSSKAEADTAAEITKQMLQGQYTRATTRRGHTKARVDTVNRAVRKDLGVVFEHVNQVIHDLSWHEWLIDATRILRAGPVDAAIRETMGPEVLRELKEALKDIAAGDVPAANQFERAVNHLRNGTTIVGMGWNLMTALMQPLGLTQSIVRIGPKWVGKGMATWFGDAAKLENTVKRVYERSPFMRLRGDTMNRELNEIRNKVKGEMAGPVRETYFYLIQKLQLVVDMPTWLGAYEKAIAQGFDEERSVALADQAVRDAQGAGQVADLARIQRGGPLQKLFTNFYNYFNTTFNLTAERFNATSFKDPLQAGRFMVDMLMLYSVPAVLGALIKDALKGGDDDEDKLVEKLIREQLNYLLGTMVGLRELGAAVNGFSGYEGPAGTRFFSEVAKLGKQVEQGEIDEPLLKRLNNAAGILLHYPAGQVNRTVEGYLAYTEGRTDNPLALVFGPPPQN